MAPPLQPSRWRAPPSPILVAAVLTSLLMGVWVLSPSQDAARLVAEQPLQPASRADLPGWREWHEQLAAELEAAKAGEGADILLYGDSILEAFRGSSVGRPMRTRYAGNLAAWKELAPTRSMTVAIAGDRAEHLLWRLQNGEGPAGLSPSRLLILIGTNDVAHLSSGLGYNAAAVGHSVAAFVQQCVAELRRQAPKAVISVLSLPPLQPLMLRAPQRLFDASVEATNRELAGWVAQQSSKLKLEWIDCHGRFLLPGGAVNYTLMEDGVHPSGPGGEVLLRCILRGAGLLARRHLLR